MKFDLEFSKNDVVIRTASLLIPRKGSPMADTATIVVKAAPAAAANKSRYAFLLTAKDAVLSRSSSGWSALGRLADKVKLGGAFRWVSNAFGWAMNKASWLPRKLGMSGMLGLITAGLTTHTGQRIIGTVVRAVVKPIVWVVSKAYDLVTGFMRIFGAPGKAIANRIDKAVYGTIDRVAQAIKPAVTKAQQILSPDNTPMKVVATIGKAAVAQALIAAFVPGGWIYLAYVIAAPFVLPALRPSNIKKVWNEAKLETEVVTPVVEPAVPLLDRIHIKAEAAAERVADDKAGAEMAHALEVIAVHNEREEMIRKSMETGEPVLSRNAIKAQRRAAAEAARQENEAKQKIEAAEKRERAAAARVAKSNAQVATA